jgi:tryptophanyl-tRNA synthetase
MRVVSGIQPTGNLHLGNYLGAIKRWAAMQDQGDCLFFLADLHAVTVYVDPALLAANVREMAAAYLPAALTLSGPRCSRIRQVPAHPELAWLLNCVARIGWLNRMTQFKEKSGKNREGASIGLFDYPVLQAADVLLYRASHVPVGEDQKQHVELMRDIALKFNTDYDVDLFVPPEPLIGGPRRGSCRSGTGNAKMSKSDPSDMSRINLTDDADAIAGKIRKAKTDAEPLPDSMDALRERPEAKNLVSVYAELVGQEPQAVLARFAGQGFGQFKPALTELLAETLRPIKARLDGLRNDPGELDRLLAVGADKARAQAQPTLDDAYRAMGLRR